MKDSRVDDLILRVDLLEIRQTPPKSEMDFGLSSFVLRMDIEKINHKLDAILAHLGMDIEYVRSHFELVTKKEA